MKSVFFLDDNLEFLQVMRVFAEASCDCKSVLASNLDEMILKTDEILKCELAFLDINLGPNMPSGIQAYRWMRSIGYNKPVYFLTGHAVDSIEAREALQFDEAHVLRKPIPAHELRELIGSHL